MRCSSCNKMVPYGEPEVNDVSVDLDGDSVALEINITVPCGECGDTLREATPTTEYWLECDCGNEPEEDDEDSDGQRFECDESTVDVQVIEIEIKRKRHAHIKVDGTYTCKWCGKVHHFNEEFDLPYAEMEEWL